MTPRTRKQSEETPVANKKLRKDLMAEISDEDATRASSLSLSTPPTATEGSTADVEMGENQVSPMTEQDATKSIREVVEKPSKANPWRSQGKTRDIEGSLQEISARLRVDNHDSTGSLSKPNDENVMFLTAQKFLDTHTPTRRAIFQTWPRHTPPSSLPLEEERKLFMPPHFFIPGHHVPSTPSFIWGSSLFDFYSVNKYPSIKGIIGFSSSSKLLKWTEERGSKEDNEMANPEMDRARREQGPKLVREVDVRPTLWRWEYEQRWGEEYAPPFKAGAELPKLKSRIPFHRLPKKLVVHDPFELLNANRHALDHLWEERRKDPSALDWPAAQVPTSEEATKDVEGEEKTGEQRTRSREEDADGTTDKVRKDSDETKDEGSQDVEMKDDRSDARKSTEEDSQSEMDVDSPPAKRVDKTHSYTLDLSPAGLSKKAFELASLERTRTEVKRLMEAFRERPHTDTLRPLIHYFDVPEEEESPPVRGRPREAKGTAGAGEVNGTPEPRGMRRPPRIDATQNGVYGAPGTSIPTGFGEKEKRDPDGRLKSYKPHVLRFGMFFDPAEVYDGVEAEGKNWVYAMWRMPEWLEEPPLPKTDRSNGEDSGTDEGGDGDDEAAHLYISPTSYIGSGNHSLVYSIQLDLPRHIIFDGMMRDWVEPLWKGWEGVEFMVSCNLAELGSGAHEAYRAMRGIRTLSGQWRSDASLERQIEESGRVGRQRPRTGSEMNCEWNMKDCGDWDNLNEDSDEGAEKREEREEQRKEGTKETHKEHPLPLGEEAFYLPTLDDLGDSNEEWFVCPYCVMDRVREILRQRKGKGKAKEGSDCAPRASGTEEKGGYVMFTDPGRLPLTISADIPPALKKKAGSGAGNVEVEYIVDPGKPEREWKEYSGPLDVVDVEEIDEGNEGGDDKKEERREQDGIRIFDGLAGKVGTKTYVGWQSVRDPKCLHGMVVRFERARRWERWAGVQEKVEPKGDGKDDTDEEKGKEGAQKKVNTSRKPKSNRYGHVADDDVLQEQGGMSLVREVIGFDTAGSSTKPEPTTPEEVELARLCKVQNGRARFRATAKLSLQGDDHLPLEASNYESFPGHWFERWTGLNLVRPLHDPVPCNPIVPQYYGYYKPDNPDDYDGEYRSPIMLLEDCGRQVRLEGMDEADRDECASLFFRMHEDHWIQNSPYERNVLVDEEDVWVVSKVANPKDRERSSMTFTTEVRRPPRGSSSSRSSKETSDGNKPVTERTHGATTTLYGSVNGYEVIKHTRKTFRLIDFGRSMLTDPEKDKNGACASEGTRVCNTFQVAGR